MNEGKTDGTDTTILSLSISNAVDTDEGRFSAIALAGFTSIVLMHSQGSVKGVNPIRLAGELESDVDFFSARHDPCPPYTRDICELGSWDVCIESIRNSSEELVCISADRRKNYRVGITLEPD